MQETHTNGDIQSLHPFNTNQTLLKQGQKPYPRAGGVAEGKPSTEDILAACFPGAPIPHWSGLVF